MRGKKAQSRWVIAEALADRYHWSWEDIKKIPYEEMEILKKIISVKNRISEAEYKKAKRK